ncbi:ATP-dependent DNA ligase [Xylariomycetidae sp. FL2044]|nr:ATP-dependent DNA ligase [Xylariomycetidae sp. FL2044]
MAPKQATLGKFFGKSNGSKPAPTQQSKLSFGTKPSNKSKDESEASDRAPKSPAAKAKTRAETNGSGDSPKDTKKRNRSNLSPNDKPKPSPIKTKVEEKDPEDSDEDLQEAPVAKRPRRNRNLVEEDEDDDEIMEDAKAVKPKKRSGSSKDVTKKAITTASKKPTPKVEEEEDDIKEEAASESASEVEDEEDLKPEVAAKAREKIQTKLKSQAKDPYPDWQPGAPVPYAALCTTFSLIELTTKRLIITEHCSLFLRQVLRLTPDDFLPTVLLMINKLAPDYAGIELGIGESLIMKAIGESTGRSLQIIKADQKEIGDLGLVAIKSRSTQPTMFKPKPLTVRGVHKGLMDIATVTGNGAQGRKVDGIKKLLSAADSHSSGKVDVYKDKGGPSEAKFIIRFLEGKLRLGLAEKTALVSIAQAVACHEADQKDKAPSTSEMEKAESILKTVYR